MSPDETFRGIPSPRPGSEDLRLCSEAMQSAAKPGSSKKLAATAAESEMFTMQEMFQYIIDMGFPVAVSIYLLIRLEGKLDRLTESIVQLTAHLTAPLG